ncbi:MAG: hypothetical protein ABSD46_02100 [Bacteroidota bacterium]
MSTKPNFSLRKWYLDCVADNGDTFIGYSGALHWKALTINYSSTISTRGNSGTRTKTSLREVLSPQISDRRIDWSSKALNLVGTWALMSEPIQRQLYDSPEGTVTWSCVHPRSKADISLGPKEHIAGLGYAELLELTVKPWQLPIAELRWGRFLSESDVLVWIEWRGAAPLSIVFLNGKQIRNASISDEQVAIDEDRTVLTLTEKTELRKGVLVSTALSAIPGIAAIVPARMLHTYECKWRSRGVLSTNGSLCSSGWVIHEIVRFP